MVTCSLVSWLGSLEESQAGLCLAPTVAMVAAAVGRLACAVSSLLSRPDERPPLAVDESGQPAAGRELIPPTLAEEWKEFFCDGVFNVLVPVLLELLTKSGDSPSVQYLSASLGEAANF